MRTTINIPSNVADRLQDHIGDRSLSGFVRECIEYRLDALAREQMVREMEAGYRAEAAEPSLEPEWSDLEVEDW